jgi:glycine betaine/proline transport system ATP-binding protein
MARHKLIIRDLFKIFGADPDRALSLLREGYGKDDILKLTGMTVGVQATTFDVAEGEIFVVMGLSGSGKSTLVRMLNRLVEPTAGEIEIDGESIIGKTPQWMRNLRLRKIAMVFQHFALFPHRTVVQNVEYGLKIKGMPSAERRERALRALEQVGLEAWAERPPTDLSGGMQQRVGLARALAVEPEILLMDEPFSALDPLIRRDMQEELIQLQREVRKTIVFITHDLNEALILGDRIAIMKEGRFVQVGTPQDIVAHPADDYVAAFTRDVDRGRVFTASSVARKARPLDLASDTPASALARMRELGRDTLYCVEGDRIAGVVTFRAVTEHAAEDGRDLRSALIGAYPATTAGAHLYEVYPQCSTGLPIAVVDGDGRLDGVVEPRDVFAMLAIDDSGPVPCEQDSASTDCRADATSAVATAR